MRLYLVFVLLSFVGLSFSDDATTLESRLMSACLEENVPLVLEALKDGADINMQDERNGQTPLMACTLRGKYKIVELLLEKGADTKIGEKDGYTPAHGAGFQGRLEVMRVLKKHGIDIASDFHRDGYAPLHRACWGRTERHADLVRYLLEEGVSADLQSKSGLTCMDMTANEATIRVLKEFGAKEKTGEL